MAKKKTKKPGKAAPTGAPQFPGNPKPVRTGPGATPEQIGRKLVENVNKGKWQIDKKLWSSSLVGIEGSGLMWRGLKNVEAKNKFWGKTNTPLGGVAEGPFVGGTGFAVKFKMDILDKQTGRRTIMEEVGVYTVKNGKIVQEEFMYGSMTPAEAAMPSALGAL